MGQETGVSAAAAAPPQPPAELHVEIPTSGVASARHFYRTLLGLSEMPRVEGSSARSGLRFRTPTGVLCLDAKARARGIDAPNEPITIGCAALELVVQALLEAGRRVDFSEENSSTAYAWDPFGNEVALRLAVASSSS